MSDRVQSLRRYMSTALVASAVELLFLCVVASFFLRGGDDATAGVCIALGILNGVLAASFVRLGNAMTRFTTLSGPKPPPLGSNQQQDDVRSAVDSTSPTAIEVTPPQSMLQPRDLSHSDTGSSAASRKNESNLIVVGPTASSPRNVHGSPTVATGREDDVLLSVSQEPGALTRVPVSVSTSVPQQAEADESAEAETEAAADEDRRSPKVSQLDPDEPEPAGAVKPLTLDQQEDDGAARNAGGGGGNPLSLDGVDNGADHEPQAVKDTVADTSFDGVCGPCIVQTEVCTAVVALGYVVLAIAGSVDSEGPYLLLPLLLAITYGLSPLTLSSRAIATVTIAGVIILGWFVGVLGSAYGEHSVNWLVDGDRRKHRLAGAALLNGMCVLSFAIRMLGIVYSFVTGIEAQADFDTLRKLVAAVGSPNGLDAAWRHCCALTGPALRQDCERMLDLVEEATAFVPMTVGAASESNLIQYRNQNSTAVVKAPPRRASSLSNLSLGPTAEEEAAGGDGLRQQGSSSQSQSHGRGSVSFSGSSTRFSRNGSAVIIARSPIAGASSKGRTQRRRSVAEQRTYAVVCVRAVDTVSDAAAPSLERIYTIVEEFAANAGGSILQGSAGDTLVVFADAADMRVASSAAVTCALRVADAVAEAEIEATIAVTQGLGTMSTFGGSVLRTVRLTGPAQSAARKLAQFAAQQQYVGVCVDAAVASDTMLTHLTLPVDIIELPSSPASLVFRAVTKLNVPRDILVQEWLYQVDAVNAATPPSAKPAREAFVAFLKGDTDTAVELWQSLAGDSLAAAGCFEQLIGRSKASLSRSAGPSTAVDAAQTTAAITIAAGDAEVKVKVAPGIVRCSRSVWEE